MNNLPAHTSYDTVPYPTIARPQTHPGHLAALAALFGLNPAPVENCRVLDLGCANGSNIIPMAYQLPHSQFVGLDLSPRQIAAGQARAEALNLKNLSLHCMNILDVGPELGRFDYIIAHGVYSWVPAQVQHKVLQICREHLHPQGIAYISYNVYPGWYMHGQVRELMLHFTRHLTHEPYSRVKQGRTLLDFLTATVPKLSSSLPEALEINHLILKSMQDILQNQPDEYLLHDHFETNNEPLYLHQFIERAKQHGLQYLADAESSALITNYLPPHLLQSLQEIAGSRIDLEQLLDFLYVRAFRQSLLCHQEVDPRQSIAPENLVNLYIASSAKPAAEHPNLDSTESEVFQSPIGATLSTRQPLNKAALHYLAQIWPQAVPFKELLAAAHARLNPHAPPVYSAAGYADDVHTLGTVLLKGYALNMVEFRAAAYPFVLEAGDYPEASAVARFEARQGKQVTNQRHEPVMLADDPAFHLLPYLDGQHSRTALLDRLMGLVAEGTLLTPTGDAAHPNSGQLRPLLAQALNHALHNLGHLALLVG